MMMPKSWSIIDNTKQVDRSLFSAFYDLCDKEKKKIISEANEILDGKVQLFGKTCTIKSIHDFLKDPITGTLWNPNSFFVSAKTKQIGCKDVKYVLELNKFNYLVRVALAFYYTQDVRYIRFISDSIKGWRSSVFPYRSVVQRIIMDMGFRIINLIQIILLCTEDETFNKETVPLINGIIYDQVEAIEHFHTARWFKTNNGMNHVTGEMVGVLVGQIWLEYLGIKKYRSYYKQEIKYLSKVLQKTVSQSGAYLEQSTNYARVVAEFLMAFDLFSNVIAPPYMELADYRRNRFFQRLTQYLKDMEYHHHLPNIGDNDDAHVLTAFPKDNKDFSFVVNGLNYTDADYVDGSNWVYRSKDLNDVFIFSRIGRLSYVREGAVSHAHNDLLSLILGINGEMIFIDKGCRYYNSGECIRRDDRQYSSHNVVSLDDVEIDRISEGGRYYELPVSKLLKDNKSETSCLFEGVMEYYGVKQKRAISYQNNTIEVVDEIQLKDNTSHNGTIRFRLNPIIQPSVISQDSIVLSQKGKHTVAIVKIRGIAKIDTVKATFSPSYGQEMETNMIVGQFTINDSKTISTEIEILS